MASLYGCLGTTMKVFWGRSVEVFQAGIPPHAATQPPQGYPFHSLLLLLLLGGLSLSLSLSQNSLVAPNRLRAGTWVVAPRNSSFLTRRT